MNKPWWTSKGVVGALLLMICVTILFAVGKTDWQEWVKWVLVAFSLLGVRTAIPGGER